MQSQLMAPTDGRLRSQLAHAGSAGRGLAASGRRHARVIDRHGDAVSPSRSRMAVLPAATAVLPVERR